MDKNQARKICFKILSNIENKIERDKEISMRIENLISEDEVIGIYSPIRNEIVLSLTNKTFVYPVVNGKEMSFYLPKYGFSESSFKILEPIVKDQTPIIPDVLIVPCVGYFNNFRLGYGGGFYDRFLAKYNVRTIGIAYKECELSSLELNKYDLPLDTIITI